MTYLLIPIVYAASSSIEIRTLLVEAFGFEENEALLDGQGIQGKLAKLISDKQPLSSD